MLNRVLVLVCVFSYRIKDEPKGSYHTVYDGDADNVYNVPIVPAEFFAYSPLHLGLNADSLIEQINIQSLLLLHYTLQSRCKSVWLIHRFSPFSSCDDQSIGTTETFKRYADPSGKPIVESLSDLFFPVNPGICCYHHADSLTFN